MSPYQQEGENQPYAEGLDREANCRDRKEDGGCWGKGVGSCLLGTEVHLGKIKKVQEMVVMVA